MKRALLAEAQAAGAVAAAQRAAAAATESQPVAAPAAARAAQAPSAPAASQTPPPDAAAAEALGLLFSPGGLPQGTLCRKLSAVTSGLLSCAQAIAEARAERSEAGSIASLSRPATPLPAQGATGDSIRRGPLPSGGVPGGCAGCRRLRGQRRSLRRRLRSALDRQAGPRLCDPPPQPCQQGDCSVTGFSPLSGLGESASEGSAEPAPLLSTPAPPVILRRGGSSAAPSEKAQPRAAPQQLWRPEPRRGGAESKAAAGSPSAGCRPAPPSPVPSAATGHSVGRGPLLSPKRRQSWYSG
eukprot:TRINITY_DN14365_c1_g2_i4.p1 TRINITY_DN14365_c1_g2~~TRINITY_DN14365_c1_g2_i4.p1  ORF type:complete len:298 (+),score=62.85 TRINITY_DN14365_c1_g2_i4:380-1273(+)